MEKGAPKKLFFSHSANRSRPEMLQPVPAECIPSVGSLNNWGSPGYSITLTTNWQVLQPADWGRQALETDVPSLHSFSYCLLLGCSFSIPGTGTNRAADKAQAIGPVLSFTGLHHSFCQLPLCLANLPLHVRTNILRDENHNIASERC